MKNHFIFFILISGTFCYANAKKNRIGILPDTIEYKKIDTVSLNLYRYKPLDFDSSKTYKAIIFFHGGGWNKGSAKAFHRQCMYFASRGMITFTADYRVRDVHGTTPFDAVKDAKSAIRFLRKNAEKFNIDPKQLVAGGGSAGGHLAAVAGNIEGLEEPDEDLAISTVPNALLLFNPIFDNSKNGYGFKRMEGRYKEISPLHNISKNAPPTIVFLGTKDKLIPVATAQDYKAKMEAVGSRCDLKLYEGQGHAFFSRRPIKYFIETAHEADLFLISLGFLEGKPTIKLPHRKRMGHSIEFVSDPWVGELNQMGYRPAIKKQ